MRSHQILLIGGKKKRLCLFSAASAFLSPVVKSHSYILSMPRHFTCPFCLKAKKIWHHHPLIFLSCSFSPTPSINVFIFSLIVMVKVSDRQISYIMHMTETLTLFPSITWAVSPLWHFSSRLLTFISLWLSEKVMADGVVVDRRQSVRWSDSICYAYDRGPCVNLFHCLGCFFYDTFPLVFWQS